MEQHRESEAIQALEAWIGRVFFLLLLAVPLAISPLSTDMYIVPKSFLAQALILLLLALSLLKGSLMGAFLLPWTPLTWPALAFLAATLLSLTKALNLYQGIEQAFSLFSLLLLLHLAALHLRTHEELARLFVAIALATVLVASYGLLQAKGIDFLNLQWRFVPVSTLGNTGFAAEYLIVALPILLCAAMEGSRWRPVLYGGAAALALVHLLLTKSRGGWAALAVALIVMAIFRRQKAKGKRQKAKGGDGRKAPNPQPPTPDLTSQAQPLRSKTLKVIVFVVAVTGIAIGCAFLFPGLWRTTVERIASILDPSYPSNRVRTLIWGSTLKMIRDVPFLGVGAGNYELVYPLYRTVEEWRLSTRLVVGEAHNDYLQIAAETGLLGLACFVWLLVRLFQTASRFLEREDEGWRRPGLALTGSLVALLVYALFAFPLKNPTASLHFWLFAGLLSAAEAAASARPLKQARIPLGISFGLALVLLASTPVLIFGRFFADLHLKRMKILLATGREQEARQEYDRAVFLYFPVFYAHQLKAKALDDRRMRPLLAERLRASLRERPEDPQIHAELGTTYGEMGLYEEAVEELKKALAFDPTLLTAQENLGYAYFLQGRYEQAIEAYQEALRQGRESSTLRGKLALALFLAGRRQEAEEEWLKARQEGPGRSRPRP